LLLPIAAASACSSHSRLQPHGRQSARVDIHANAPVSLTDASDRPSDADGDPQPNLDADIGPNQEGGAQGGDAADAAAVPDNPTQTATHVAVIVRIPKDSIV